MPIELYLSPYMLELVVGNAHVGWSDLLLFYLHFYSTLVLYSTIVVVAASRLLSSTLVVVCLLCSTPSLTLSYQNTTRNIHTPQQQLSSAQSYIYGIPLSSCRVTPVWLQQPSWPSWRQLPKLLLAATQQRQRGLLYLHATGSWLFQPSTGLLRMYVVGICTLTSTTIKKLY